MSSTSTNLSLTLWSDSDQFSLSELNANWNILDDIVASLLIKDAPDTLTSSLTLASTGSIKFGSSSTITMKYVDVQDTTAPTYYRGINVNGPLFLTGGGSSSKTLFLATIADTNTDKTARLKIRSDGKVYFGNGGTTQDVAIYRDAVANELLVQLGTDVDGSDPSYVLASPKKHKKYQGPGLGKTNYVWNPDFEIDTAGWLTTSLTSVTAASTSITQAAVTGTSSTGTKMGQIVTPGSAANEGVRFPIYRQFQSGTQYNIKVKVYAPSAIANIQVGIGNNGVVYASSTPQALSTTWTEISTTWTPISTVDSAFFFVRLPTATAATWNISEAKVYVGSTPTFVETSFPVAETFPRWAIEVDNIAPVTNTQYVFGIPVERGQVANRICILAGSQEAVGITGSSAGLYSVAIDGGLGTSPGARFTATRLVATPTLETFLYQGPNAPMIWDLSSPYRFTYTGIAYIAFVIAAGTMPYLAGRTTSLTRGFTIRGYHWYPLNGSLSTGTSLPSSGFVGDTTGTIGASLPYAWIS